MQSDAERRHEELMFRDPRVPSFPPSGHRPALGAWTIPGHSVRHTLTLASRDDDLGVPRRRFERFEVTLEQLEGKLRRHLTVDDTTAVVDGNIRIVVWDVLKLSRPPTLVDRFLDWLGLGEYPLPELVLVRGCEPVHGEQWINIARGWAGSHAHSWGAGTRVAIISNNARSPRRGEG